MTLSATVIVPTHNRPDAIAVTVGHLLNSAARMQAEVVVVDDGSTPPLSLPSREGLRLMRTTGVERSRARNHGACSARGDLLIFVDDDITVAVDFVEQHLRAAEEFGGAIGVGRITLPRELSSRPFGRFRRIIEEPGQNRPRGLVAEQIFCTAQNMSIRRNDFLFLGGFDPVILSGEDQDLALRHSQRGGRIVFLPEADAIHRDSVANISAYGHRHEWGARAMAPFLRRYPDRPENEVRRRLGTPIREARFPGEAARILVRLLLARGWPLGLIRGVTGVVERAGAGDRVVFSLYRLLLGLHLFRGFRAGLFEVLKPPPLPAPLTPVAEDRGTTNPMESHAAPDPLR